MIDTKALRSRVLDMAIQGKLTEQLESDGTAEELWQQIQAEKQRLIKEGKIKREKPLPEITPDEIPFEIPENWKWVRLKSLGQFSSGKTPSMSEPAFWNGSIAWVSSKDIKKTIITDSEMHITELAAEDMKIHPAGTLLLVARSGILRHSLPLCVLGVDSTINQDIKAFSLHDLSLSKWVYYALKGLEPLILKEYVKAMTTVESLKFEEFSSMPIPLPPLAEQKRIVARVEEIFRLLDIIDAAQERYAADAESLKAKLITLGIQGRLTEQFQSDGTAEELYQQIQAEKQRLIKEGKIKREKPLPEITPDEIPFEIPENWKWCRLNDIIDVRDGTHDSPKYHKQGIPLVTSKNLSSGTLDFENTKLISIEDANKINERSLVEIGDILFAMIGTIGNPVIVNDNRPFCIKNVALFKRNKGAQIDVHYLYYYLLREQNELRKITVGGLQPFVSLKMFRSHLIPLPPLAEQKRIAETLERVLGVLG